MSVVDVINCSIMGGVGVVKSVAVLCASSAVTVIVVLAPAGLSADTVVKAGVASVAASIVKAAVPVRGDLCSMVLVSSAGLSVEPAIDDATVTSGVDVMKAASDVRKYERPGSDLEVVSKAEIGAPTIVCVELSVSAANVVAALPDTETDDVNSFARDEDIPVISAIAEVLLLVD